MNGGGVLTPYGLPGFGGRTPVAWIGPDPVWSQDGDLTCRRPVVAVLDTGAGKHWWLPKEIVDRKPMVDNLAIGLTDPKTDGEISGTLNDPLEGTLDSDAGHGTFIAGLIRQICPDAKILAVRIMYSDGVVQEGDLLKAVNRLLFRQELALSQNRLDLAIDVISMSLGYYHELPSDKAFDQLLLEPLKALGERGVAVVAAAGNDATPRHMYPAAFTPNRQGPVFHPDPATVPVVSVGALNPDGRTIALFSNAGPWVSCHRRGVSLVSTLPTTFNGALQAPAAVFVPGDGPRAGLDLDDFEGGFATWSGTSFAAPVLAAQLAQHLLTSGSLDDITPGTAVARAWSALGTVIGLDPPAPH
jgi:subtilisin family serine protease